MRTAVARGVAAVVAAIVVAASWMLASPHGSSPDDGYHLSSIWCAQGYQPGRCLELPGTTDIVLVPHPIANITCNAFASQTSARCITEAFSVTDPRAVGQIVGGNIRGERPGLYYRAMHVLVSDDELRAIFLMRWANALTAIAAFAAAFALASRPVRDAMAGSWLVASVPLGLFLLVSTNSSAWGTIGIATLWAAALTALTPGPPGRRGLAAALAVGGAVLALGSRRDAPIFIVVALVSAAVAARRYAGPRGGRDRSPTSNVVAWTAVGVIVVATLGMVALRGRAAWIAAQSLAANYRGMAEGSGGDPWLTGLYDVPFLYSGALGDFWGLGWLDTPVTPLTYVLMVAAFGAVVALGLAVSDRTKAAALTIVAVAMVVIPPVILMSVEWGFWIGQELQPRHFLPFLYLLAGTALLGDEATPPVWSRAQRRLVVGLTSVANAAALHVVLRRYTAGLPLEWFTKRWSWSPFDLGPGTEWWWWEGAPGPMVVWAIGSVAFAVLATLAMARFAAPGDRGAGATAGSRAE